jgi:MFS family permease
MGELEERVRNWHDAGLVSEEQLTAILAFEARHGRREPDGGASRRTMIAEAVGYVGAALAIGAIALLLRDLWPELLTGGRLMLVGVLTVLLLGSGFALRRTERGPVQRLTSVLLTGGVIGVGWLTAIVAVDVIGWREARVALAIGVVTGAVALPLYLMRSRALPQVTLLVTVIVVVTAALSIPALSLDPMWYGLVLAAVGVGWLLLGMGGWLHPRRLAEAVGAVVAVFAMQSGSFEHRVLMLSLGVALAGGLVGLAVASDRVHHLVVGAVGLFLFVPQLVFELFGDAIGAPATLLVIGLLLVLLAVGLGRARREVRPPRSGSAGSSGGARPDPGHVAGGPRTPEEVGR